MSLKRNWFYSVSISDEVGVNVLVDENKQFSCAGTINMYMRLPLGNKIPKIFVSGLGLHCVII